MFGGLAICPTNCGGRRPAKKGSPRLTAQLEAVLAELDVLPFDSRADSAYGLIRARLEQAGQTIRGNDLLIAAQTISFGYTMVTDNERNSPG
jgi:tRNA(fMet)-specific endonuclease VapC